MLATKVVKVEKVQRFSVCNDADHIPNEAVVYQ